MTCYHCYALKSFQGCVKNEILWNFNLSKSQAQAPVGYSYPPQPGGYGAPSPNQQSCGLYPQPGGPMLQPQGPGMGYPGQPGQPMPGYPRAPSPNPGYGGAPAPMPGYPKAPSPNPSMPAYGGGAMPVAPPINVRGTENVFLTPILIMCFYCDVLWLTMQYRTHRLFVGKTLSHCRNFSFVVSERIQRINQGLSWSWPTQGCGGPEEGHEGLWWVLWAEVLIRLCLLLFWSFLSFCFSCNIFQMYWMFPICQAVF